MFFIYHNCIIFLIIVLFSFLPEWKTFHFIQYTTGGVTLWLFSGVLGSTYWGAMLIPLDPPCNPENSSPWSRTSLIRWSCISSCFGEAVSNTVCTYSVLQAGVDVNAGSPATPLTLAAGKGLTEFINCLLEAGADANIPDEVSFILIFSLLFVALLLLFDFWISPVKKKSLDFCPLWC